MLKGDSGCAHSPNSNAPYGSLALVAGMHQGYGNINVPDAIVAGRKVLGTPT